jgi:uncharacterized repeat protein (TIGR03803 family)
MRTVRMRFQGLAQVVTLVFALGIVLVLATPSAHAQTLTTLYTFTGGADGGTPYAGLVLDSEGNLYGSTNVGGSGLFGCIDGCGTVFKLDTAGQETVLHSFGQTVTDGESPHGSLFRDPAGSLYGSTAFGGSYDSGTLFRVGTNGKEAVFSFSGGTNGGFPDAGLVPDAAGNVYGTTTSRGSECPPHGCGTVFKVNSSGKETVLYSFAGGTDGSEPNSTLVRDSAGNLFGTTIQGGASGFGTVFEVNSAGKETVLYSFAGEPDGSTPYAGLVMDSAGNLYGTTAEGGSYNSGTVFKLDPTGQETVLYNFCSQDCADGALPYAGLIRDSAGNLYGTTLAGGGSSFEGTVFKLAPSGQETVLYSFSGYSDGGVPYGGLVMDSAGDLYGTTSQGGIYIAGSPGYGTVFKIVP